MDRRIKSGIAWVALLGGLLATRAYGYLLFHSFAEVFAIVVAAGLFMIVWNARDHLDNEYLRFIGVAYAFVAVVDVLHMLAYRGMGVFATHDPYDLPTQLWIAGRYLQASALVLAPMTIGRKIRDDWTIWGCALATAVLLVSIFGLEVFPAALVEDHGLTTFKIVSEYVVAGAMAGSIWLLRRKAQHFEPEILRDLSWSIAAFVAAELAFTLYTDPFGTFNLLGHLLRIVGFALAYRAVVVTALARPQDVIFRGLKREKDAERGARENAEELVAELLDTEVALTREAEQAQARYEREHAVADTLQRTLLEAPRELPGFELGHLYASSTARVGLVGGDFFDVFEVPGGAVALIGDVSGKGLEAAVLGTLARGALKTHAVGDLSPPRAAGKVNEVLYHFSAPEVFVTACIVVLDPVSGALRFSNAGHPSPMIIGPDGTVRELPLTGDVMLGAFAGSEFAESTERMLPDETLFMYTDGVLEARAGRQVFGADRLRAFLSSNAGMDPDSLLKALFGEVLRFSDGSVEDDIAMLALRYDPGRVSRNP
jgi:serine phosphatase RsbU (regulator of sigma subunit)